MVGATAFTASACTNEPVSLLQNSEGQRGSLTSLGPGVGLTAGHVFGCETELVTIPLRLRGKTPLREVWKDCSLDAAVVFTGPEFLIPVVRYRDAETLKYGEELTLVGFPGKGGVQIVRPFDPINLDKFPPFLSPFFSSDPNPQLQKWPGRFVGLVEMESPEQQDGFQELVVVAIYRPLDYIVYGSSGGIIEDAQGNYVSLIQFWALPEVTGVFLPEIQEQFGTEPFEELVLGVRVDHILERFGQGDQSSTESTITPIPCLGYSC